MNKMQMNSALWNLVNQDDIEQSAQTVIELGQEIPLSGSFQIEFSKKGKETSSFSGETNLGQVNIKDEVETNYEKEFGVKIERIGHFKLRREKGKKFHAIEFWHFWASDETTRVDESSVKEYIVIYTPDLQFYSFGIWEKVPVFSLWIFHFSWRQVKVIHGKQGATKNIPRLKIRI